MFDEQGEIIMNERKNDITEAASEEYRANTLNYGEMIIEMVERINNQSTLEYLHRFLKLFLEKWG